MALKRIEALADRRAGDAADDFTPHLTEAFISEHGRFDKGKRANLADWLMMVGAWGVCFLMLLALLAYVLFFMVPWALSGVIG